MPRATPRFLQLQINCHCDTHTVYIDQTADVIPFVTLKQNAIQGPCEQLCFISLLFFSPLKKINRIHTSIFNVHPEATLNR